MAYATDADLLARVPAASAVPTETRAVALVDAQAVIDDRYGDQTVRAHCMLAAHYLATTPGSGLTSSGTVASRSAGAISVSYAVAAPTDEDLGRTQYGLAFRAIRNSILHAPEVG